MSGVDARYLGLTANQLAKIATDLESENAELRERRHDLLTEYGMATTAYLLMAMSIDSLERRNKQLEAENAKLREYITRLEQANLEVVVGNRFSARMIHGSENE